MKEHDWRLFAVHPDDDIKTTMQLIDRGNIQFALVVDGEDNLLGIVTDGDVRRGLIRGAAISDSISTIMHKTPVTLRDGSPVSPESVLLENKVFHLPVIDARGKIKRLFTLYNYGDAWVHDNLVVIMAGGLGSRMGSVTKHYPKPMLRINDRPILEHIITEMSKHGFKKFCLCVNHLSKQIVDHFGDGSGFGVDIAYVHEVKRMGTAGALSMLPDKQDNPVIVLNGDVLVKAPWEEMLRVHGASGAAATMATVRHEVQVPYGVVRSDAHGRITGIEEKPVYSMAISAGVNILSPEALAFIPADSFFDMPDLFKTLVDAGKEPRVFGLDGYWIDIGRPEDYAKAADEYDGLFIERHGTGNL